MPVLFQPRHFPPSFCLSNTALLPTSLETLSHTLPPASPELPTAICYKNFSVGPHVVWFLKSCSPFLTWSVGYWVVTGPLNDVRKIRQCRQCLVLINSVLSGPCTVVRVASYNCGFDASGNVLARSRLRCNIFKFHSQWSSTSIEREHAAAKPHKYDKNTTDLIGHKSCTAVGLRHDSIVSGSSLVSTREFFIHTSPLASAEREKGGGGGQPPFGQAWLMPELFSPHFIWWSSASSPPLSIIRHGRSPSTTFSLTLSLPPFLFLSLTPSSLHPPLYCKLGKVPPPLLYPPFCKTDRGDPQPLPLPPQWMESLSFQHFGCILSARSC